MIFTYGMMRIHFLFEMALPAFWTGAAGCPCALHTHVAYSHMGQPQKEQRPAGRHGVPRGRLLGSDPTFLIVLGAVSQNTLANPTL